MDVYEIGYQKCYILAEKEKQCNLFQTSHKYLVLLYAFNYISNLEEFFFLFMLKKKFQPLPMLVENRNNKFYLQFKCQRSTALVCGFHLEKQCKLV